MGISPFFPKAFKSFTWVLALLLLLACIVPYVRIPAFAFLSLTVPLLVILNVISFLLWLLFKRNVLWHVLVALVLGYASLGSFVRFHNADAPQMPDGLKVMSYNVQGFFNQDDDRRLHVCQEISLFVTEQDPDIICFQEYSRIIKKRLSVYPFVSHTDYSREKSDQGIYSKYPIIAEGSLGFPNTGNSAIYADILFKGDTLRVYNVHLESLKVRPGNLKREQSTKLFGRLEDSFAKQYIQAELLREHAERSPYPNIFCTDLNNNQFSYTYKTIKGRMTDTFSEKGYGYGRTIDFWRFPLRIDFILVDPSIQVQEHRNYTIGLSDHEPIMATLDIPK